MKKLWEFNGWRISFSLREKREGFSEDWGLRTYDLAGLLCDLGGEVIGLDPKSRCSPPSLSQVPQRPFPKFNMEASIFFIYFLKVPQKLLRSMHISQGHNLGNFFSAFLEHALVFLPKSNEFWPEVLIHRDLVNRDSSNYVFTEMAVTKVEVYMSTFSYLTFLPGQVILL